jgi:hypothetical protein
MTRDGIRRYSERMQKVLQPVRPEEHRLLQSSQLRAFSLNLLSCYASCYSSCDYSLASYRGDPGSIPCQMWDFWCKKWHRGKFFRVIRFPLSIIPPTALSSSSSIFRDWYNRPNSGTQNWTNLEPTDTALFSTPEHYMSSIRSAYLLMT